MRDIKFRAWDKIENTMALVEEWHKTWIAIGVNDEDDGHLEQRKLEDIKLMQYTGLQDKNGVEIYEGDILQWSYRKKDELCIVSYQDQWGSFVIDSKRAGRRKITHVLSSLPEYGSVVVGNIYENPELLKQVK